jgi:hypothetical protein
MNAALTFLIGLALGFGSGFLANVRSSESSSTTARNETQAEPSTWLYCYQVAIRVSDFKCKSERINQLGYLDALSEVAAILARRPTHFGVEVRPVVRGTVPVAPSRIGTLGTLGRKNYNILKRARINQKCEEVSGPFTVLEICFTSSEELDTTPDVLGGKLNELLCTEIPLFGVFPSNEGMTEEILLKEFPHLRRLVEVEAVEH